jgi:hypothetical protein
MFLVSGATSDLVKDRCMSLIMQRKQLSAKQALMSRRVSASSRAKQLL